MSTTTSPTRNPQDSVPFRSRPRRTLVACSNCRRLKRKCITKERLTRNPCARCTKRGLPCEYIAVAEQEKSSPDIRPLELAGPAWELPEFGANSADLWRGAQRPPPLPYTGPPPLNQLLRYSSAHIPPSTWSFSPSGPTNPPPSAAWNEGPTHPKYLNHSLHFSRQGSINPPSSIHSLPVSNNRSTNVGKHLLTHGNAYHTITTSLTPVASYGVLNPGHDDVGSYPAYRPLAEQGTRDIAIYARQGFQEHRSFRTALTLTLAKPSVVTGRHPGNNRSCPEVRRTSGMNILVLWWSLFQVYSDFKFFLVILYDVKDRKKWEKVAMVYWAWYFWLTFARSILYTLTKPEIGACGSQDRWIRVDRLVRKRRSGEIKKTCMISPQRSSRLGLSDPGASPGIAWRLAYTRRALIPLSSPALTPGPAVKMVAVRVACIYAPLGAHASPCSFRPDSALPPSLPVPATLSRSFRPERQCCCRQDVRCAGCALRAFTQLIDCAVSFPVPATILRTPSDSSASIAVPRTFTARRGRPGVARRPPRSHSPSTATGTFVVRAAGVYAQLIDIPFSFPVPGTLLRSRCVTRGTNCGIADMHRLRLTLLLISHVAALPQWKTVLNEMINETANGIVSGAREVQCNGTVPYSGQCIRKLNATPIWQACVHIGHIGPHLVFSRHASPTMSLPALVLFPCEY
ncbi:hypothetical protein C8R44DRAFT_741976 [Mycena epipterygia]|nr:hypothetical protein C8R44DRAFT_741976 [Mycena epipterygia]